MNGILHGKDYKTILKIPDNLSCCMGTPGQTWETYPQEELLNSASNK
jgi:hypothetical protein